MKSIKKLLFITCRPPYPLDDGWKIRCFHLMKSYRDRGWLIDLLSFITPEIDDSSIHDLSRFCRQIYTVPRKKRYAFSALLKGVLTSTPFPVMNYTSRNMMQTFSRIRQENHYDLIQVEDIMMCDNLGDISGEKIILDMHNVQSELMRRYAGTEKQFFKKLYAGMTVGKLAQYEKRMIPSFSQVLVCSEEDRQLVHRTSPKIPVTVVANGVDLESFSRSTKVQEKDRLVFVGDLGYHANKVGVNFFLEKVFPLVRQRFPAIQAFIVGKNPPPQISAYNGESVVVTGKVPDVRIFLESAKVVVVPLLTGGGTRLKILEAMAMGKAIVSTSIGCEGIPAQHNKHIVLADTPESFAEEVCRLLADGDRRCLLGQEAQDFVKKRYDWKVIGEHLNGSVDSLMKPSIAAE